MDSNMGEAGEGPDEVKTVSSDTSCVKLNGDMNGAYDGEEGDEPMEVSETSLVDLKQQQLKKISSEEIGGEDSGGSAKRDVPINNSEVPNDKEQTEDHGNIDVSDEQQKRVSATNGYSNHELNDDGNIDHRVCEKMDCDEGDDSDVGVNEVSDGHNANEEQDTKKSDGILPADSESSNGVTDDSKDMNIIDKNNIKDNLDVRSTAKSSDDVVEDDKTHSSNSIKCSDNRGSKKTNANSCDSKATELSSSGLTVNSSGGDKKEKELVCDSTENKVTSSDNIDDITKDISDDSELERECMYADKVKDDMSESDETERDDGEFSKDSLHTDKDETGDSEPVVIDIDLTPEKNKKSRKSLPINVTPRRSSRNLNKQKSYIEKEERDIVDEDDSAAAAAGGGTPLPEDPDIEEIQPQDPLADASPIDRLSRSTSKKTTIVVSDTKRLAEIAAGSKNSKGGKKEPTLVIIDTNSILSGRGPVPLTSQSSIAPSSATTIIPTPPRTQNQGYSVLPVALSGQGMYSTPPGLRTSQTTIKPVMVPQPSSVQAPPPKPPIVLPSLTDDMFVVEAPSFIVPYVYEKPPMKPLKEYVNKLEEAVKEIRLKLQKDKEEQERLEKEKEMELEKDKKEDENCEKAKLEDDKVEEKDNKDEKKEVKVEMDVKDSESKDDKEKDKNSEKEKTDADDKPKDLTKDKDKDTEKDKKKTEGGDGTETVVEKKKGNTYFDNALGKFFMQIGINLVQEHVQTDLLRSQKRKREKEGNKCPTDVHMAINSLMRTLEFSKENNEPFKMELKKCEFCSFKTESSLVLAHHLETPHMRNYVYRCNFCTFEVRSPHDILFHMEAEHNVRGRLERAPAFHQCPSCPFEDNQKGKLTRHLLSCAKKYRPERNQEPPLDWEPPAKIPRVPRNRPSGMSPGSALYQAAMSGLKQGAAAAQAGVPHPLLPKLMVQPNAATLSQTILNRGRGRPQLANRFIPDFRSPAASLATQQKAMAAAQQMRPGMVYRPSGSSSQPQVLLPTSYQVAGNQLYQGPPASSPIGSSSSKQQSGAAAAKLLQQPSISITPLPRQAPAQPQPQQQPPNSTSVTATPPGKPGRPLGSGKATFVICEICDGYIKDLELLRNHMQWIHKVKIHPKMIYNRPPLNCQKCQFRFFTDQGLERHLLGSHGLVTSSMQEAANKGKDGGRCPVCGRVYQWKLLNHVARDHNMSLKPAHLSYKCTVCTATFGMYKQFENHVYSAHSVVAKRVMDKKAPTSNSQQPSTSSSQSDSLLKPLKINDEITIIPQPPRNKLSSSSSKSAASSGGPTTRTSTGGGGSGNGGSNKGKV